MTDIKEVVRVYSEVNGSKEHDIRIGFNVFSVWKLYHVTRVFKTIGKAMELLQARHCYGIAYNDSLYLVFRF